MDLVSTFGAIMLHKPGIEAMKSAIKMHNELMRRKARTPSKQWKRCWAPPTFGCIVPLALRCHILGCWSFHPTQPCLRQSQIDLDGMGTRADESYSKKADLEVYSAAKICDP